MNRDEFIGELRSLFVAYIREMRMGKFQKEATLLLFRMVLELTGEIKWGDNNCNTEVTDVYRPEVYGNGESNETIL